MNSATVDQRLTLTRATMSVLDSWNLRGDEASAVLGISARARTMQKFRSHQAFPEDPALDRRADYILRIAGALRTANPVNPSNGARWLRQRHRRLGVSPLSLMLNEGEAGLVRVLAELDCTFCWELNDRSQV